MIYHQIIKELTINIIIMEQPAYIIIYILITDNDTLFYINCTDITRCRQMIVSMKKLLSMS